MKLEVFHMARIGEDFPQTREARKRILKKIREESEPVGTFKVPGYGRMNVYRIPLTALSYNPYNTRFLAQAKTLEKRLGRKLDDEKSEDLIEIEQFIWDEKPDKNANTIDSLCANGQLEPGVVTINGVILSGNRRFRMINEITRNHNKYGYNDDLNYFEAVILENELTEKQIVRYESFFTYGMGEKVEYDAIQKYIAAEEQHNLGLTDKEIADNFSQLTEGGNEKIVKKWLIVFGLMKEYLVYIGEEGIYTALKGTEESFLKLNDNLKSLRTGKAGRTIWAFSEDDLDDLKCIFFDYIRLGIGTHDFRDFLEIFSDQERWKKFRGEVNQVVEENRVESFETYREEHPNLGEKEISEMRKNDYVKKNDKLKKIYGREKAVNINQKVEETPMKLIEDVQQKLSKLEEELKNNGHKDAFASQEFYDAVKDVMSRIGKIKQKID